MPLLGFGTWRLRGSAGYEAVLTALQVGYRHLDTATMYGNEAEVGHALRDSGLDRSEVFVTTKLPPGKAGQERKTLCASLRALGTTPFYSTSWDNEPSRHVAQRLGFQLVATDFHMT